MPDLNLAIANECNDRNGIVRQVGIGSLMMGARASISYNAQQVVMPL
jgi:hypothetical protein